MQDRGFVHIHEAVNPDFQYTLFEAQKAFARSGDENVESVLVNLLAARAAETSQTLRQVVLNEAVTAMARLTSEQVRLVTLLFILRHTKQNSFNSPDALRAYLSSFIELTDSIPNGSSVYSYLTYSGIATNNLVATPLPEIFRKEYPGLLSKGLPEAAFSAIMGREPAATSLMMPCLNDANLKQVFVLDKKVLDQRCDELALTQQTKDELANLMMQNLMNDAEVQAVFAPLGPRADRLFQLWASTGINQYSLTAVGLAIGHANAVRMGVPLSDLGIWVQ